MAFSTRYLRLSSLSLAGLRFRTLRGGAASLPPHTSLTVRAPGLTPPWSPSRLGSAATRRSVAAPRTPRRGLASASRASAEPAAAAAGTAPQPEQQRRVELVEALLEAQLQRYLAQNPTSSRCLELVQSWQQGQPVCFDHVAFRSFGACGLGIASVMPLLQDCGYTPRDTLAFPAKKLRALWFAPPAPSSSAASLPSESCPTLPRVFVSELAVEELSGPAQGIIRKYAEAASSVAQHAFGLSSLLPTPWPRPSSQDYLSLASESEYAAWTLVNGYSLNHTTISIHHLGHMLGAQDDSALHDSASAPGSAPGQPPPSASAWAIDRLDSMLEAQGIKLNKQGGTVKVSPDGLLLQSSTVADSAPFTFSDGVVLEVPRSYMEFALRLVLPEYSHVPPSQITEQHRRDGFEVGNADKIFESTSSTQSKGS